MGQWSDTTWMPEHAELEKIILQIQDLPPAPTVLHSLERLLAKHDCSLEQVGELISMEPGLAARVVKIANSTQFGGASPVKCIIEAIQRVGLNGVHEVVTFALASQLVGQNLDSYKLDANTLWFMAIASGLAASGLTEYSGLDKSEAYTTGLLHGLGFLVVDRYVRQNNLKVQFKSIGFPHGYLPSEKEQLGFDHAEAGAALLKVWGFSEAMVASVLYQSTPQLAPPEYRKRCMTLAVARWARFFFCINSQELPELPPPEWLKEIDFKISEFNPWLNKIRRRYNLAKTELRLS